MTSKLRGKTGGSGRKSFAAADLRDVVSRNPAEDYRQAAAAKPAAASAQVVAIDLHPSPDASQALSLKAQAASLVVNDRDSHSDALQFLQGAKQLYRKIDEHWRNITRNVDALKKNLLDLKERDLAPVQAATNLATEVILAYENAEKERQRVEEDRNRREAEEKARKDREADLARQEAEAAALEAQSPSLSARETYFVRAIVAGSTPLTAARGAGYKTPFDAAAKLITTPKIVDAIATANAAIEIREQAAAVKQQPLDVVLSAPVESNLGKASGVSTRTTYSMEVVDADTLFQSVVNGASSRQAFEPNVTFLNAQARALKESFEQAYPGCRLVKRQTVAG